MLIGFLFIYDGYSFATGNPFQTESPYFLKTLPSWSGRLFIEFTPTLALVIGDNITANVSVQLFDTRQGDENKTFYIEVLFPDALVNRNYPPYSTTQDYYLVLDEFTPYETSTIYSRKISLMYAHEGIYGLNMTIHELKTNTRTDLYYPDVVTVKPLSYIEEKKTSRFIAGLNIELLGIGLITLGPIIVQLVGFVEKLLVKKEKTEKTNS
jgi:hypothetical protein